MTAGTILSDYRCSRGRTRLMKIKQASGTTLNDSAFGGKPNMSGWMLVIQRKRLQRARMTDRWRWLDLTGSEPIKDHFQPSRSLPTALQERNHLMDIYLWTINKAVLPHANSWPDVNYRNRTGRAATFPPPIHYSCGCLVPLSCTVLTKWCHFHTPTAAKRMHTNCAAALGTQSRLARTVHARYRRDRVPDPGADVITTESNWRTSQNRRRERHQPTVCHHQSIGHVQERGNQDDHHL